jgi:hypothetical protein
MPGIAISPFHPPLPFKAKRPRSQHRVKIHRRRHSAWFAPPASPNLISVGPLLGVKRLRPKIKPMPASDPHLPLRERHSKVQPALTRDRDKVSASIVVKGNM